MLAQFQERPEITAKFHEEVGSLLSDGTQVVADSFGSATNDSAEPLVKEPKRWWQRSPVVESDRWELLKREWKLHQRVRGRVCAVGATGAAVEMGIVIPGVLRFDDAGRYNKDDALRKLMGQGSLYPNRESKSWLPDIESPAT